MTVAEKYITEFNRLNGKKVYKSSLQQLLTKVKAANVPELRDVQSRLENAIASMNGHPVKLEIKPPVKYIPVQSKPAAVKPVKPEPKEKPVVKKTQPEKQQPVKTIVVKPDPEDKPAKKLAGKASSIFQPIGSIDGKLTKTFRLKGDVGKLLGDLESYELAATIEGDQGAGKTQLAFQFADSFADSGFTVGILELEIGSQSVIVRRNRDKYIKPANRKNVYIAGFAPDGINTVRAIAKDFDVVIIDSWQKLDVDSSEFDKLRKDFTGTAWIVLFQRTSGNTIRGGTKPLYDAGINIEVNKVDDTFVNNYAVCTKNRYGETGIKYNIHSRSIVKDEPAEKKAEQPEVKEESKQVTV